MGLKWSSSHQLFTYRVWQSYYEARKTCIYMRWTGLVIIVTLWIIKQYRNIFVGAILKYAQVYGNVYRFCTLNWQTILLLILLFYFETERNRYYLAYLNKNVQDYK